MKDKGTSEHVAKAFLHANEVLPKTSSPPAAMIRAMANTLYDHDIDVLNDHDLVKSITTLICAGFPAKDVEACLKPAAKMAAIRRYNLRYQRFQQWSL